MATAPDSGRGTLVFDHFPVDLYQRRACSSAPSQPRTLTPKGNLGLDHVGCFRRVCCRGTNYISLINMDILHAFAVFHLHIYACIYVCIIAIIWNEGLVEWPEKGNTGVKNAKECLGEVHFFARI